MRNRNDALRFLRLRPFTQLGDIKVIEFLNEKLQIVTKVPQWGPSISAPYLWRSTEERLIWLNGLVQMIVLNDRICWKQSW